MAQRVSWLHTDLTTWVLPATSYDLVSAQFMHLPKDQRDTLFHRLAASVAPSGSLLIVGHSPQDLQTAAPRPPVRELYFTAPDVAASFDRHQWDILVTETRAHSAVDPAGRTITVHDEVFRAQRKP